MDIMFEVSGLEESSGNALKRYEVQFSEPINADWLIEVIEKAIKIENEKRKPEKKNPLDDYERFTFLD